MKTKHYDGDIIRNINYWLFVLKSRKYCSDTWNKLIYGFIH